MNRRSTRFAAALVVVALGVAGCSGDDEGSTSTVADGSASTVAGDRQPLRIEAMPAAVAAVEAELGGAQRYFEVNATPTLVNLFVAGDGTATAYVYDAVDGTLDEPTEPQEAAGDTFTWDQVSFDAGTVLAEALVQAPNALPRAFAVTAGAENALQYLVTLESRQGGVLDVLVTGKGEVIGVQAR